MNGIFVFKDGGKAPAAIERMFGKRGPYLLEGRRLDLLSKVQLVVDSSTSTTTQVGTSTSTAKTGNMVKRAVVGGVLLGGAGALAGGVTGTRESEMTSTTTQKINTELTAELIYEDGKSQYVFLTSMDAFHWLLGFANEEPMSEEKLQEERALDEKDKADERMRIIKESLHKEISATIPRPATNRELMDQLSKRVAIAAVFAFLFLWMVKGSFWLSAFLVGLGYFLIWGLVKDWWEGRLLKARGTEEEIRQQYESQLRLQVDARYAELINKT